MNKFTNYKTNKDTSAIKRMFASSGIWVKFGLDICYSTAHRVAVLRLSNRKSGSGNFLTFYHFAFNFGNLISRESKPRIHNLARRLIDPAGDTEGLKRVGSNDYIQIWPLHKTLNKTRRLIKWIIISSIWTKAKENILV